MIEKLSLKNVATYNNEIQELKELKEVNFIYGANGSGKTTISNYIKSDLNDKYRECQLIWKNGVPLETFVYNKSFKDENFLNEEIQGVFTLGNATIEQEAKLKTKNKERAELESNILREISSAKKLEGDLNTLNNELLNTSWELYNENKPFKEALKGFRGSKKVFYEKLMLETKENKSSAITKEDLEEKSLSLMGKKPDEIEKISAIDYTLVKEIEKNEIFKKSIVGKNEIGVSKLIEKLKNSDWVREGITYLGEDSHCPFCQSETITDKFKEEIESYFDETFEKDVNELKKNYIQYLDLTNKTLENILKLQKNEILDFLKHDKSKINDFLIELRLTISKNTQMISDKLMKTSVPIELKEGFEILVKINAEISEINEKIETYNNVIKNFKTEKIKFISEVWKYLVDSFEIRSKEKIKSYKGINRGLTAVTVKIQELAIKQRKNKNEILELNRNFTSIQPTIDEINRMLNAYGFNSFTLARHENSHSYCLKRENGELAHATLSEGETTFITFLYFLQLIKGGNNSDMVSENRIVVIDDPISSLDSNVLFLVSALIKEVIKDIKKSDNKIKQLIVLTHNVYFHKEVSFTSGRVQTENKVNFWIVRKKNGTSFIDSYEKVNPIKTSYQLLWNEIKNYQNNSGITIQNTLRRILENYFKILGGMSDEDLVDKFENPEEKNICTSLLYWINDGSHCLSDDLLIQSPEETIETYIKVFKNVFKYTGNIAHYEMMMTE